MSCLFTGDFQAELSNLDLCEQAWNEVLSYCIKYEIKTLVFLGDGKQTYHLVDVRVIRFWQDAISKATAMGIVVVYLLGNHDRVGQYNDADNWLSVLSDAGALMYDKPGIAGDGERRIFMLPYSTNSLAKSNMKLLMEYKPDKSKDILCFHHDLKKVLYNNQGSVSDADLDPIYDLCSSKFMYCIGGHIHNPQTIKDNVYYVGSPFCHDWGEVNQRKRYLIVGNNGIKSIFSSIPGWFDPSVNAFEGAKPRIWKGARIRISVSCDASTDYGRRIEKARHKAERKYKGADIFVVPKFIGSNSPECTIKSNDTDERKLKEYCRQVKYKQKSMALEYMLEKLSHFSGGLRTGLKVKFLKAKGTNFLPFKKIETDFTVKGITVIQGVNHDRSKKSNGSGKTSTIQLIPVAMFGKTFKGQSSDGWATRGTKDHALSKVYVRDHKGRIIQIERGRKPPLLRMLVDGHDVSSGMKSNDKDGTQAQIEQTTGFTWQTLANAVYIDRTIADAFLSGTKKQRTDVLSRFQNLERFARALELVKKDERKNREGLLTYGERLLGIRASIIDTEESVNSLKSMSKLQLNGAYKEYSKRRKDLKLWKHNNKIHVKVVELQAKKLKIKYKEEIEELTKEEKQLAVIKNEIDKLEKELLKWHEIKHEKICPLCLQDVSPKWLKRKEKELHAHLNSKIKASETLRDTITIRRRKVALLDGEYTQAQQQLGKWDNQVKGLIAYKKTAQEQWIDLSREKASSSNLINRTIKKLKGLIKEKKSIKHKIKKCNRLNMLYEFAMEAFSRDGIPAFLNQQLCPILNKAASYYADLFSDNEIQVQFKVEKGEFIPTIINPKGGEGIDDQSTGERALAGLIASFALREVAPRCNLLILDEPGEGLDAQTAKQFARALQHLVKRFKSIWVVTHNVHILSELSGERMLTVVKHNKVSILKENYSE